MNLKDTSVGIEAAGIKDGILSLVEMGDLLLQALVYTLEKTDQRAGGS